MAVYSSKPAIINAPATDVAERFSDFTSINNVIAQMPEEERAKIGQVECTRASIIIQTAQVGQIELTATERTPQRITLQGRNMPVPLTVHINMRALDDNRTELVGSLELEVPKMMEFVIGPMMQKVSDQFGKLFASLA